MIPVTPNDPEELVKRLREEVVAAVSSAYVARDLDAFCAALEKEQKAILKYPKWLRAIFRNQGRYNALVIQAICTMAGQLQNQIERQERELARLRNQIERLRAEINGQA